MAQGPIKFVAALGASLLARMRTHEWEGVDCEILHGVVLTVLTCSRCGAVRKYPMTDQAAFNQIHRSRGCKK